MKHKLLYPPGTEGRSFRVIAPVVYIESHHHTELEVNVVISGRATYLFGLERTPLVAGTMIWLFPAQEHVLMECSPDFAMWVLVFSPRLVQRVSRAAIRRWLRSADPGGVLCRQLDAAAAESLHAVYQCATAGEADIELTNNALAFALLASWRAYENSNVPVVPRDVHPAVARAARLVAAADEPLTLNMVAASSGLSPARLSRLFKAQTGVTLTAFRQRQAVQRFLHVYGVGRRYSLTEAALLAGFGSYPQFHRVFRQVMGKTPADYRASFGSRRTSETA